MSATVGGNANSPIGAGGQWGCLCGYAGCLITGVLHHHRVVIDLLLGYGQEHIVLVDAIFLHVEVVALHIGKVTYRIEQQLLACVGDAL